MYPTNEIITFKAIWLSEHIYILSQATFPTEIIIIIDMSFTSRLNLG